MKVLSITRKLRRPQQILSTMLLASGFVFVASVNVFSQTIEQMDQSLDPGGGIDPGAISQPVIPPPPPAPALGQPAPPAGALAGAVVFPGTQISDIDSMPGWESCTTCAGAGGAGPTAPYSMSHSVTPSLDGNSAHFWLGGSHPYSNALWWKQLGPQPAAHNFVYDFYFYMTNPAVSQAIEFDMNQSVDGRKLIFGTECNIQGKHWDVWDTANRRWVNTGIYCGVPPAYTWNHVTLEFQRASGDQVRFVAVTLNGQKSYINRTFGSQGSSVQELNVAVQMDGNYAQTNYDMWVDKINVNYW
jgi:hypothetical protein